MFLELKRRLVAFLGHHLPDDVPAHYGIPKNTARPDGAYVCVYDVSARVEQEFLGGGRASETALYDVDVLVVGSSGHNLAEEAEVEVAALVETIHSAVADFGGGLSYGNVAPLEWLQQVGVTRIAVVEVDDENERTSAEAVVTLTAGVWSR